MELCDTFKPIPVTCDYCNKEFSSSTILFHHKKHHPELAGKYTPNRIQCQKCLETVQINSLFFHNTTCEKRLKKVDLLPITEEKEPGKSICRYCKRKFASNRIEKHQTACETACKKRPIFDILRKRVPYQETLKLKNKSRRSELNLKYSNSKWQKQHIQMLKNLRVENEISFYEDFVTCPHCSRRFAPASAEKHVEICKNIFNKPKPLPTAFCRNLPELKNSACFNVKTNSLKNLTRPGSVICRSKDKNLGILSTSIDETSTPELSPGRFLKDLNPSIRESRSLSSSKRVQKFSTFDLVHKLRPSSTIKNLNHLNLISIKNEKPQKNPIQDRVEKTLQSNQSTQLIPILQSSQGAHLPQPFSNQSFRSSQESKTRGRHQDQKRSKSSQKLGEVTNCHVCGFLVPGIAKFCSMCGVIRGAGF